MKNLMIIIFCFFYLTAFALKTEIFDKLSGKILEVGKIEKIEKSKDHVKIYSSNKKVIILPLHKYGFIRYEPYFVIFLPKQKMFVFCVKRNNRNFCAEIIDVALKFT